MAGTVTFKVRDQAFNAAVDDHGRFTAKFRGSEFTTPNLEALKEKLAQAMSQHRVKISVPYMELNAYMDAERKRQHRFELITITGLHGGTKNWLKHNTVTNERSQDTGYSFRGFKVMDTETQAEGLRLFRAMNEAEATYRAWSKEHSYDPQPDAQRALKEAQNSGEAPKQA